MVREYALWNSMITRCTQKYCDKHQTYINASCSDNFKSYTFFYEWCQEQIGFGNKDNSGRYWQLDKDLLIKGNKLYSEDTCVFLPHKLNCLLIKAELARGEYPIGVYWKKKSKQFCVQCTTGSGTQKYLGLFSDYLEAFKAYKDFKERYIKVLAEEHRHQLDPRAYNALMDYQVEETD